MPAVIEVDPVLADGPLGTVAEQGRRDRVVRRRHRHLSRLGERQYGGGFLEPLKIQQQQAHHGALTDPASTIYHALANLAHGHHIGDGLHVPWIGVAVVLLVVAFWRLPVSYGAFALCVVVIALSGSNLDSFERYALSAFPLVLAGATLLKSARVATVTYVLCGAAMALYAVLAFQGAYVP